MKLKPFCFYLSLIYLCLFTCSPAHSAGFYKGCCSPFTFCDFQVGYDFLWWKPCINDLSTGGVREEEVVDGVTLIDYKYSGVCTDWEPGVRLFIDWPNLFCWCDTGFRMTYSYVAICDYSHITGPDTTYQIIHPGAVSGATLTNVDNRSSYEATYHEWDALLYFDCCCGKCHYIRPQFGLAGIYFDQELKSKLTFTENYAPGNAEVDWDSDYWGIGLRMGMEYHYYYSSCLRFFAFGNGTFLAGEHETENDQEFWATKECQLKIKEGDCFSCVPGFHLGAGGVFSLCICRTDVDIRFGYEFLKWYGLPKHRIFTGDDAHYEIAESNNPIRDIGFHGLFLGMGINF